MITAEQITINDRQFTRIYSDSGFMVERDGVRYSEAIDPAELGRTYTESNTPREAQTAATEADYQDALREMGG